jgi:ligand-binding SRPBCC domain-containing protein
MPLTSAGELDITQTNRAVQELIEVTENPRHRYLLQAYDRHRNLEHAGRYEEIFAPEMIVEHPVYPFNMLGQPPMQLEGREQVKPLYRHWAETHQSVFYNQGESVAVGDWMVVSTMIGYQQTLGSTLAAAGVQADADAMYLLRGRVAMIWPYDEQGRLVGENVWEYDPTEHDLIRLTPDEVLTTTEAAELLESQIKPLPRFQDDMRPQVQAR